MTGIVLTSVELFITGSITNNSDGSIKYLKKTVSYENKSVASFKVLKNFVMRH